MSRLSRVFSGLLAILLAGAAVAQSDNGVGRTYWYEPAHERFAPTDFYREPNMDGSSTRIVRKDRLQVVGANKGWLMLRAESMPSAVYLPIRIFRSKLYLLDPNGATSPYDSFMRASIFDTDPDEVAKAFKAKAPGAPALASGVKSPSWQKYKEKWAVSKAPKGKIRPPVQDADDPEGE